MPDTMIGRVAEALSMALPSSAFASMTPEEAARAVLIAMREPTEVMVEAWFDAPLELPDGVAYDAPAEIVDPYHARSDWRAMIDAALAEQP